MTVPDLPPRGIMETAVEPDLLPQQLEDILFAMYCHAMWLASSCEPPTRSDTERLAELRPLAKLFLSRRLQDVPDYRSAYFMGETLQVPRPADVGLASFPSITTIVSLIRASLRGEDWLASL